MNISRRISQSYLPIFLIPLLLVTLSITANVSLVLAQEAEEADPAEITNGERLFLETRFAQFFKVFLDGGGSVNEPLPAGDPALDNAVNWKLQPDQFAVGPFAGQSMNCRSCHFVDEIGVEEDETVDYGMRTYSDFARRSPIPAREDGHTTTVRNSPPLVNASLPRKNIFLHFDAEFPTMVGLVQGTLTGRNYGWISGEAATAIAHIAKIAREDDGLDELASEFENIPYATLLTGTDPTLPEGFVLPEEFRVDVANATDDELFQAIAQLIAAYTEDLAFSKDADGNFNLSPYDVFLQTNGLPRQPRKWESDISYSQRLLRQIRRLEKYGQLKFVSSNPNTEDGEFEFHSQPFVFEEEELQGLKIFFKQKHRQLRPSDLVRGTIGNCIACHTAPNFTDFQFHNTGIAQAEYDGIHGAGDFARLAVPGFWQRLINHNDFLPATEQHPQAKEPFRAIPTSENPQLTDLGLWNIFLNFDFPEQQLQLWQMVCKETRKEQFGGRNHFQACRPNPLLRRTIAQFKTPGLRDLSHSAPYSHTGQADTLEDVIRGYIKNAELRRVDELRNGDRELKGIALTEQDIKPLKMFLQSLNEDYS
jgi:cytochrome c peroxidase